MAKETDEDEHRGARPVAAGDRRRRARVEGPPRWLARRRCRWWPVARAARRGDAGQCGGSDRVRAGRARPPHARGTGDVSRQAVRGRERSRGPCADPDRGRRREERRRRHVRVHGPDRGYVLSSPRVRPTRPRCRCASICGRRSKRWSRSRSPAAATSAASSATAGGVPIAHAHVAREETAWPFAETDALGHYDLCTHFGEATCCSPRAVIKARSRAHDQRGHPARHGAAPRGRRRWHRPRRRRQARRRCVDHDRSARQGDDRDAVVHGRSAADGTFRLNGVAPGHVQVTAIAPGARSRAIGIVLGRGRDPRRRDRSARSRVTLHRPRAGSRQASRGREHRPSRRQPDRAGARRVASRRQLHDRSRAARSSSASSSRVTRSSRRDREDRGRHKAEIAVVSLPTRARHGRAQRRAGAGCDGRVPRHAGHRRERRVHLHDRHVRHGHRERAATATVTGARSRSRSARATAIRP